MTSQANCLMLMIMIHVNQLPSSKETPSHEKQICQFFLRKPSYSLKRLYILFIWKKLQYVDVNCIAKSYESIHIKKNQIQEAWKHSVTYDIDHEC
jgi:hypothetical protein